MIGQQIASPAPGLRALPTAAELILEEVGSSEEHEAGEAYPAEQEREQDGAG
jgi:hypothetical protein